MKDGNLPVATEGDIRRFSFGHPHSGNHKRGSDLPD
jgi:hypothetical protein